MSEVSKGVGSPPVSSLMAFWILQTPAGQLAPGAAAQSLYHKGRIDYWTAEQKKIQGKISAEKAILKDAAGKVGIPTTVDKDGTVMSHESRKRLTKVEQKIAAHERLKKEYDGWNKFLAGNPDATVPLTRQDWAYFMEPKGDASDVDEDAVPAGPSAPAPAAG